MMRQAVSPGLEFSVREHLDAGGNREGVPVLAIRTGFEELV